MPAQQPPPRVRWCVTWWPQRMDHCHSGSLRFISPDRTPDAAVHSWLQREGTAQPESPEKVLTGDGAQSQTGIPTEPGLNNIFRLLDSEISRGQGGGLPFFIPNTTRPRPQGGKSESEPHVIVNSLSHIHTYSARSAFFNETNKNEMMRSAMRPFEGKRCSVLQNTVTHSS